jgi:PAS domain S-box-containing protein
MSTLGAEHRISGEVTGLRRRASKLRRELDEEPLKTSESPFALIFNGVSDLLFLIGVEAGPQFRCLMINHSYVKRTGRTREQIEGKLIEEIVSPEQARFVIAKYTAAIQTRGLIVYEESADVPAGQLVVETTLTPVFDEQGNCTHLLGDSRDITERKRMEKALRESEERHRHLFENANDALATFTLDGTITAVNRAAEQLIGWSRAELIGQHVNKVATPASVALAEERAQHFLAGKRLPSSMFEAELVHKDGSIVAVEARTNAIRNAAGKPIGFQGIYRDITERRRTEEALQEAYADLERRVQERTAVLQQVNEALRAEIEERKRVEAALRAAEEDYRMLFKNAVEGIYRSSLDGKQLRANPALVKLNGYSSEEEQIAGVNDIATEWYVDPHRREEFARILEEQGTVTDFESEIYRHKTRERIWISETARLVRDTDGAPLYYEGTVQDITAYKHAEETLRALNESLEQKIVERTAELTQTNNALQREIDRRKRTEEALRESEQRYRDLFENANDMITTLALDGTFTSVNKQAEITLGFSRNELIGTDSHMIALPSSAALGDERTRRVLAGERVPSMFEIEVIRKDGRTVPLEARIRFIRDKNGLPVGFQGIYRDITERKKAERALRESEERYRIVSQSISDYAFSFHLDAQGEPTLEWLTDSFTQVTGYSVSELLRKPNPISQYVHPEDLDQILYAIRSVQPGKPTTYEFRIIRKDGVVRWLQSRVQGIADENGKLMRLYGAAHDVTGRKLADTALRESEQRYRAVVETQTELVCRFRPDTTLTFVNDAYCRYFGKSREELLGTSFLALIPGHAQPATKAHVESLIVNPRLVVNEHEALVAGGHCRWQRWTDQAIFDYTGRLLEFQSTGLDITEQKRAEEALRQLQAELAHVNRVTSMGEMAASIAHEVNQPLGAIVGNADICLRWLANEMLNLDQVREALSDIIKDGHRASTVIARIRSLIKRETLQKTSFNINEVIGEAVALASHEVQRQLVRLRTELAADLPSVLGDRIQLGQVMLNLIMNGIEAMSGVEGRARNLILRSGRHGADRVLITVQDCGAGIDPREAKRIFAPFHTTKPGGMGMGLAICQSIVEAHGGRLWVESNDGLGAAFQFTLPSSCEEEK